MNIIIFTVQLLAAVQVYFCTRLTTQCVKCISLDHCHYFHLNPHKFDELFNIYFLISSLARLLISGGGKVLL